MFTVLAARNLEAPEVVLVIAEGLIVLERVSMELAVR